MTKYSTRQIQRIAVTGGKGGTGKSTAAVLLAASFLKQGKRVLLVDVDVECPNDYLLIGEKLEKEKKRTYIDFPELNKKKCKKCGICVKTCRENAIFQPRDKNGNLGYPIFIKDLCSGCGACWNVCPYGAIKPKKETSGKIYLNKIEYKKKNGKNLYLITGEAKAGLEETGPVVRQVREFALDFAKKKNIDIILFDTAPGIHCPVINALLDCDMAYCVTEPTPMGAYDLGAILNLCKKLKIPAKVILNQADLGNKKKVYSVVKKFKADIFKEIKYSKQIVNAYSKGQLLILDFLL